MDIYTRTPELKELTNLIGVLHTEAEKISKEIAKLAKKRAKLIDADAAAAETLPEIWRYSGAGIAGVRRLEEAVRAYHPAIQSHVRWTPPGIKDGGQVLLGVQLALDYTADSDYLGSLADALERLVTEFEVELPPEADGSHYAKIMDVDCASHGSWSLRYDLVSGLAQLKRLRYGREETINEGEFVNVLRLACEKAWYSNGPEKEDDY